MSTTRDSRPSAIALIGPTASGKTDLSMVIAETRDVEIISTDSALVYRDMTIGTAKPSMETLASVPHHLIDIVTPLESYSAAQYRTDAIRLMGEIASRGKTPLLVGGTMLYYHVLTTGLDDLPEADPTVRAAIDIEAAERGWPALHAELETVDPITAARLSPNDSQRIQRALEIFHLTRQPMSALLAKQGGANGRPDGQDDLPCRLTTIALTADDRSLLHQRIADRFEAMLEAGLIDEVIALRRAYPTLTLEMPSMRCVGYRQVWQYLEGQGGLDDLRKRGKAATRQLCKRQLTWLRSMNLDHRIDAFGTDIVAKIQAILASL